jgi:hypothetical protein
MENPYPTSLMTTPQMKFQKILQLPPTSPTYKRKNLASQKKKSEALWTSQLALETQQLNINLRFLKVNWKSLKFIINKQFIIII